MNPLQSIILPERDATAARRPAKGTAPEGFDDEIRGAQKRASQAAEGALAAEEDAATLAPAEDAQAAPAAGSPDRRDMMGLLQALVGMRATPEGAGAPAAQDQGAETSAVRASPSNDAPVDTAPDAEAGGRARLKLVHQETHFEPTLREAVLVDRDAGAAPEPAAREKTLMQLLDDAPKAKAPVDTAAVANPAGRPVAASDAANPQAALARPDPMAGLSARAALAANPAAKGELAVIAAGDGMADDAGPLVGDEPATPRTRRERPLERSPLRESQPSASTDRQPAREAPETLRFVSAPASQPGAAGEPTLSTQIATRIVDAFAGTSSLQRPDAPNLETHLRLRAGGSVLKTLTIELQPEHLGTLNVSMRLKEGQLTLEMAASRAETAMLLSEDRPALKALLEKAGFSLDEAAIVVVARDSTPAPAALSRDAGTGGGERAGGQAPGGGGSEGGSRESPADRRAPPSRTVQGADAQPGAGTGTVFL